MKLKAEMDKINKINMGATNYQKQQKLAEQKGKLNAKAAAFTINEQGGGPNLIGKEKAPNGQSLTDNLDPKALEDELKALMKELVTERDDARQHVSNILMAEQKHAEARRGLDAVLDSRKLMINKSGQVSKQPDP